VGPLGGIGGYHVDVVVEHERLEGFLSVDPRHDEASSGCGFVEVDMGGDPAVLQLVP
jgi:hypothetical protein